MDREYIKKQFEKVYEAEIDSLFRYCAFRISSREQAMDIVQDVFIEFWQILNKDEKVQNSRAFLFAVLRNRIIDWYRKKKAVSLDLMLENNEDKQAFEPIDSKSEDDIILSAESKRVVEMINTLDANYQEVLYFRLVEDLQPEEIASLLKINANTVSVRITRGLAKLRDKLKIEKLL